VFTTVPGRLGRVIQKKSSIGWAIEMKKFWSLLQNRMVWTTAAALLTIVALPAIFILVLKALGFVHGASPHTWLLDSELNVPRHGLWGGAGSGLGGRFGHKGPGKGGKGGKGVGKGGSGSGPGSGPSGPSGPSTSSGPVSPVDNKYLGNRGRDPSPGYYTPTPGYTGPPADDPAFKQAQQQLKGENPQMNDDTPPPPSASPNPVYLFYQALVSHLQGN
jgi:hypothetical protein